MQKSVFVLIGSMVLLAGCGSGDGFSGVRAPVSGKITIDGKPAPAGCKVTFLSPVGSYVATGVVKDNGKYEMFYNGNPKLPAVKYQVMIIPPEEAKTASEPNKKFDPQAVMDSMKTVAKDPKKMTKPKETGPFANKYMSAATSGLMCTVIAGPNAVDFDLDPPDSGSKKR